MKKKKILKHRYDKDVVEYSFYIHIFMITSSVYLNNYVYEYLLKLMLFLIIFKYDYKSIISIKLYLFAFFIEKKNVLISN